MSLIDLMKALEHDLATAIHAIPATNARQAISPVAKIAEVARPEQLEARDELTLWDWLIADGDSHEGAQEVIDLCARDTEARSFFLNLARKHFLNFTERK